jgi:hypothetical protein
MVQVRRAVLDDDALGPLVGHRRVFCGASYDIGYDPAPAGGDNLTGPGIVLTLQGGRMNTTGVMAYPTLQARVIAESFAEAWALDAVLTRRLDGLTQGRIRECVLTVSGAEDLVPETLWPSVVSTYRMALVIADDPHRLT